MKRGATKQAPETSGVFRLADPWDPGPGRSEKATASSYIRDRTITQVSYHIARKRFFSCRKQSIGFLQAAGQVCAGTPRQLRLAVEMSKVYSTLLCNARLFGRSHGRNEVSARHDAAEKVVGVSLHSTERHVSSRPHEGDV